MAPQHERRQIHAQDTRHGIDQRFEELRMFTPFGKGCEGGADTFDAANTTSRFMASVPCFEPVGLVLSLDIRAARAARANTSARIYRQQLGPKTTSVGDDLDVL